MIFFRGLTGCSCSIDTINKVYGTVMRPICARTCHLSEPRWGALAWQERSCNKRMLCLESERHNNDAYSLSVREEHFYGCIFSELVYILFLNQVR